MATTDLRPTGVIGDTDAWNNLAGPPRASQPGGGTAADGDTINLKARKLADEPAGPLTSFAWGRATLDDATINTPGSAYLWSDITAPFFANNHPSYCAKGLIINGDVDGSNDPETVVTSLLGTSAIPADVSESGMFVLSEKTTTIQNIQFKDIATCVHPIHPFNMLNCRVDGVRRFYGGAMDDRNVFPNIALDDFDTFVPSLVKDCSSNGPLDAISHGRAFSGLTMQDCTWGDTTNSFAKLFQVSEPDSDFFNQGLPFNTLETNHLRQVTIKDCTFSNTGGVASFGEVILEASFGGTSANLSVDNCTFTDSKSTGTVYMDAFSFGFGPTELSEASITNCTFTGTQVGSIIFEGVGGGTVVRGLITGNTLVNTYDPPIARPAIRLLGVVLDSTITGNDYTASGNPKLGPTFASLVLFGFATQGNTLFEPAVNFPVGQGGAKNHVTDFGVNRVVTGSASNVEKPAGIGQTLEQVGRPAYMWGAIPDARRVATN